MRLQLTPFVLLLLFSPAAAEGVDRVAVEPSTRFALYKDSDHTTIWTSTTGVTGRLDERWQISARYLVDVVSSASVDVVSQATGYFHDTRHDVSASAGYRDEGQSLIGSYSYSTENDWQSHNATLSASKDLLQHNLTLAASAGLQDNTITRANSFGFEERLRAYLGTLGASYTLTARDLVQLTLAASFYDGFQSSPYRYLTVAGQAILERHPDHRFRRAVVLRHHHYFGSGWALRSHARLYGDTFGVESLTLGTEAAFEHAPFDWALSLRGYAQSKANFYREVYTAEQRYMTWDKELSRFVDVFFGPTLGYGRAHFGPFEALRIEARASGFYFDFSDFATLDRRYGILADLGASAAF